MKLTTLQTSSENHQTELTFHLPRMTCVTEMGGIIFFSPVPGYDHRPQTLAEMMGPTVSRVLDLPGQFHGRRPDPFKH